MGQLVLGDQLESLPLDGVKYGLSLFRRGCDTSVVLNFGAVRVDILERNQTVITTNTATAIPKRCMYGWISCRICWTGGSLSDMVSMVTRRRWYKVDDDEEWVEWDDWILLIFGATKIQGHHIVI